MEKYACYEDSNDFFESLALKISELAKKTILRNNEFKVVLTGGNSYQSLYKSLAALDLEWKQWKFFITDERFVTQNSYLRNSRKINNELFSRIKVPKKNINFMKPELGVDRAILEYEKVILQAGKFDLVLLSYGRDGHIASLFPRAKYPRNRLVVIERNSPKLPKKRISLSYETLNNSENIIKLISGNNKKSLMKSFFSKKIPSKSIVGDNSITCINKNLIPLELQNECIDYHSTFWR